MANKRNPSRALKICVVGGSIAGCTAAIELLRAGHRVEVYERSPGELQGRGAGIGTPRSVIDSLIRRDLIDAEMPHFRVTRMPHIGRASDDSPLGHTAWTTPLTIELLNWGDLYRNLRRRVPDDIYSQEREVINARVVDGDKVRVRFAGGRERLFDLVIFADGYRSLGRRLLFPDTQLQYRGYALWRGELDEAELADPEPLEGALARIGYAVGHCDCYLVPGRRGSVARGKRRVNWGFYVRVPAGELPSFLVDRTGRRRSGSLPPGSLRPELEAQLKQLARRHLPPYFAGIISAGRETSVQPIYTAEVPAYAQGRICLLGDAGAFAQPFTASGVFKGMNNAIDLGQALAEQEDVDQALAGWSKQQTLIGRGQIALGRRLEQALIWRVPDFSTMSEEATRAWWQDAARMPEELFPAE